VLFARLSPIWPTIASPWHYGLKNRNQQSMSRQKDQFSCKMQKNCSFLTG